MSKHTRERVVLRKGQKKNVKPREVEPFSVSSLQRNVLVKPFPPRAPIFVTDKPVSKFRQYVISDRLPIKVDYGDNIIIWKTDIRCLNYECVLPVFFEGLCDGQHPYPYYAEWGLYDLLLCGKGKIVQTIPYIIQPIRKALRTKNKEVIVRTLEALQLFVLVDPMAGPSLVPYFKSILPLVNAYKNVYPKSGDELTYSGRKISGIAEEVNETLELLEKKGGPDAFINIKYCIPTYESINRFD